MSTRVQQKCTPLLKTQNGKSSDLMERLAVCVVDDNQLMRQLVRAMLSTLRITKIREATDGVSALNVLREFEPDLIITDCMMSPMNGIEFTELLRTRGYSPYPYVPIIMMTGHTELEIIKQARDSGVTEILAKPISARGLCARVRSVIEQPRKFVSCESYFGPDRRRQNRPGYKGPWRRSTDPQKGT